jgi:hypothetical protein
MFGWGPAPIPTKSVYCPSSASPLDAKIALVGSHSPLSCLLAKATRDGANRASAWRDRLPCCGTQREPRD